MNYFAHGINHLDRPYFLAGTAVPDWLNVVDRKVRVRAKRAQKFQQQEDPQLAEVVEGILQHHHDDDWFHRTAAFAELSWQFTVLIRDHLAAEAGLRPSFLGHIMVELLLDSYLIQQKPELLDQYYRSLTMIDAEIVQTMVNLISLKPTTNLPYFIKRFLEVRFLEDYPEDEKLFYRLNQVMQRVKLPVLPESFLALLPEMRMSVNSHANQLLAKNSGQNPLDSHN